MIVNVIIPWAWLRFKASANQEQVLLFDILILGEQQTITHYDQQTMTKIAILGGSGYTAAELINILLRHPAVEIVAVTTRQEGTPLVTELHPRLTGRINLRCEPLDPDRLVGRGVECAFGCLPHGVSMATLPVLLHRAMRVIDLSADYRLRDPNVYAQWYGHSHEDLAHLAQAVYGLPELYGEEIVTAQLVANPGCYPQTAILGLAPLVAGNHIQLADILIDSKSGVSGAGRTLKLSSHFVECNESVSAYAVGQHRHTPEIEQALADIAGENMQVIFTPHQMPMDRGIFSTIYAKPRGPISQDQVLDLFRAYYAKAPFIQIREDLPATKDTLGTNFLHLTARVVRDRIIVLACEDNLVRGASGVAVQNFNLMYGHDVCTALL
ncbi:MAG: N-acetyl-gamma-glutamyl-phosphate reductase [Gemmataceae bacterium]